MISQSLCIRCRGAKYLCGLSYCPIIVEQKRINIINSNEIQGSSPPTVFTGRYNYPKITVYPSSPPVIGDTSKFENAKEWLNDLNEFLSMRLSLIRGGISYNVNSAQNPDRVLLDIQTLALAEKPVDVELKLKKSPSGGLLDDNLPPFGPSAPLDKLTLDSSSSIPKIAEKVYYDNQMKARDGIMRLYNFGFDVEKIAKILSVGALGIKRKLVPTRWSITAVDKTISETIIENSIKTFDTIDKIEVYYRKFNKNLFIAILLPEKWGFEWGEAWYPGSTWNKFGNEVAIEIDNEGFNGRNDYPEIGGCYYASMLGVVEFLHKRKRQAKAILWREIYQGFNLPIGVWFVRENIREMFKSKPIEFDDLNSALNFVKSLMRSDIKLWLSKSLIRQDSLEKWLR